MTRQLIAATILTVVCAVSAGQAVADPILKPRKYHGPIPRSTLAVHIGFIGGPSNEDMILFLDRPIKPPFEGVSTDFDGSSLAIDVTYTRKVHPQFGVRVNTSAMFLHSGGRGFYVPQTGPELPDSILADVVDYERNFDTVLMTLELSAIYFFEDASVEEFQPYAGGGFTVGIPFQKLSEDRVSRSTGDTSGYSTDQWSTEAGVHAVAGAHYYWTNVWSFVGEARVQMVQSKFPISAKNENGDYEKVKFDVNYSGFSITVGVARSF